VGELTSALTEAVKTFVEQTKAANNASLPNSETTSEVYTRTMKHICDSSFCVTLKSQNKRYLYLYLKYSLTIHDENSKEMNV
jgi:hypothetical protein